MSTPSFQIGDRSCVSYLYKTAFLKFPTPVLRLLCILWGADLHFRKDGKEQLPLALIDVNLVDLVRSLVGALRVVEIAELREQSGPITDARQRDLLHQLFDLRYLERNFEQGKISMCSTLYLQY